MILISAQYTRPFSTDILYHLQDRRITAVLQEELFGLCNGDFERWGPDPDGSRGFFITVDDHERATDLASELRACGLAVDLQSDDDESQQTDQ
jgi:hypothetical protein